MKIIHGIVQRNKDEKGFWSRIGVAFENKDGSLNLKFDYFPTNPETTIQVREQEPREEITAEPPKGGNRCR